MIVGYGSVAIAGPWKDKPTIYEFHVMPPARGRVFELFEALIAATGAVAIETQSNNPQLTAMLHVYGRNVASESILFHDRITTHHPPPHGAIFREAKSDDAVRIAEQKLDEGATWLLELDDRPVATGGVLFLQPPLRRHLHVAGGVTSSARIRELSGSGTQARML